MKDIEETKAHETFQNIIVHGRPDPANSLSAGKQAFAGIENRCKAEVYRTPGLTFVNK